MISEEETFYWNKFNTKLWHGNLAIRTYRGALNKKLNDICVVSEQQI